MVAHHEEQGFTVVEMVVTLVVVGVFLGLLFQTYMAGLAQQSAVTKRAAADDIAETNLRKITSRSSSLLSSITCISSGANKNAVTSDTDITNETTGVAPAAVTNLFKEPDSSLKTAGLSPGQTKQTLRVLYPRGCSDPSMPMLIISTVTYGSGASDKVTHASYVN